MPRRFQAACRNRQRQKTRASVGAGDAGRGSRVQPPGGEAPTRPPRRAPRRRTAGRAGARSAFAPEAQAKAGEGEEPEPERRRAAPGTSRRSAGMSAARAPRRAGASTAAMAEGRGEAVEVRADRRARVADAASAASARSASRSFQTLHEPVGLPPDEGERRADEHGQHRDLGGGAGPERAAGEDRAADDGGGPERLVDAGRAAPRLTAPSQNSSSGAATRSPPGGSPSAHPATGARAIGRDSIAWRKPLRSTAASPATSARTR